MLDSFKVKKAGIELGLDLVGITGVERFDRFKKIADEEILAGKVPSDMRRAEPTLNDTSISCDPRSIMPKARSIIALGLRYHHEGTEMTKEPWDPRGKVARHHWDDTYADLEYKRDKMIEMIRSEGHDAFWDPRVPVKPAVCRSGVGVFGKNTLIQNEDLGSWVIYSVVLTDAELEPDEEIGPRCGSCQRCIRLCPTKAIPEPFVLDPSKCLSYVLSSERPIPIELREAVEDRIDGCDVCQEVCPRNEGLVKMKVEGPQRSHPWGMAPKLLELLKMDEREYLRRCSSLRWHGPSLRTLKRNAIIALGNTGDCSTIAALEPFVLGVDEDLAEHARWAMDAIRKRESDRTR
ncbi:MAG: hypothetical protein HPY73_08905 [Methanomassiliicoccales archaeon]|nr:MAG: hypothetical protein HPY73_08905 [Methanomassiliicoccales archaeon]